VSGCGHSFHSDCATSYILKVAEGGADVLCPVCFVPLNISVPECAGEKRRSRCKEEDEDEDENQEKGMSAKRQKGESNYPSEHGLACNRADHQVEEPEAEEAQSFDASFSCSSKELSPRSTIERIRETKIRLPPTHVTALDSPLCSKSVVHMTRKQTS